MSYQVIGHDPLKVYCKNNFPELLKVSTWIGVLFCLIALTLTLGQIVELWTKVIVLVIIILFIVFSCTISSNETLEITNNDLVYSRDFMGQTYLKKIYGREHVKNIRVYPNINQKTPFDPKGLFSEKLRLYSLGGSIVFDYGPLNRSVLLFKGLNKEQASEVVELIGQVV
ncbi:hypothetical protein NL53_08150 [Vibrio variabilis]|uniref:PH domain-containing protein n=1 Tax=Vibrio variabilis TaxID=990271 RepID=A0ABR4YC11_9VIBR|nr:hypothetical protein [Vibrio variabilis]KHA61020.1 hypothetical protein NL53_08150 [Vibrio variabilis]